MLNFGGTAVPLTCQHCGRPCGNETVFVGSFTYHPECASSPYKGQPAPANDGMGTVIPRYLTETEVLRIVRKEIAEALEVIARRL